jgi:hypothetical protein
MADRLVVVLVQRFLLLVQRFLLLAPLVPLVPILSA